MKKSVMFLTLCLLAWSSAEANGTTPPKDPPANPTSSATAAAAANATGVGIGVGIGRGGSATSNATGGNSSATQGQNQQQDQSQHQQAEANNAGNSLSTSSYYKERLQAPAHAAPPVYASNPCAIGKSAGLSIPGGAISGGKATVDPNCDRREAARVLTPLNPWLALKVMCADPYVKEVATPEECVYVAPTGHESDQASTTTGGTATSESAEEKAIPRYVTWEDLEKRDQRMMRKLQK